MAMAVGMGMTACTNLDEKVYDRIDAGVYYQNEASVKVPWLPSMVRCRRHSAGENFFHLSEYPAYQITWRVWLVESVGMGRGREDGVVVAQLDFRRRLSARHGTDRGRVSDWLTCC